MAKPLIGICMDHVRHFPVPGRDRSYLKLYPTYAQSVSAGGGTPLVIPMLPDVNELRPLLEIVRGVVLIGSDDYPAEWYGKKTAPTDQPLTPERAAFDRAFIRLLLDETDLPVFGVCGGMQLTAIHTGGALIQDLPVKGFDHRQPPEGVRHHDIEIEPDSRFAKIFGATRISVNTMHHQAVERAGKGWRVSARASDGVIEAMEHATHPFRIGVQWHPERMPDDPKQQALFRAFATNCGHGA